MRSHFVLGLVLVSSVAACGAFLDLDWKPKRTGREAAGGGGGAGGATAETVTAATTTTAASVAATTATGPSCSPEACPGVDAACAYRACLDGACGMTIAPAETPCAENGGVVCDGSGNCVHCVSDGDCGGDGARCEAGQCTSCHDGVKNGTETDVDCGGECPKCSVGQTCLSPHDCEHDAPCENGSCTEK